MKCMQLVYCWLSQQSEVVSENELTPGKFKLSAASQQVEQCLMFHLLTHIRDLKTLSSCHYKQTMTGTQYTGLWLVAVMYSTMQTATTLFLFYHWNEKYVVHICVISEPWSQVLYLSHTSVAARLVLLKEKNAKIIKKVILPTITLPECRPDAE